MNTFYHGDCLFAMNHDIPAESVDLIYLDPPFFTGKIQKGIAKWQPEAMEVSYKDSKKFWGDTEKVNAMRTKSPEWLRHTAQTRPDFASYLFYMMERLEACHKVLKETGSIYLHCDEKASHYLKMIMDKVFGFDNYKNEIVWHYGLGAFRCSNGYPSKHDDILFYAKNIKQCHFNKLRGEVTKAMAAKYCHYDENGNYMMSYGKKYYLQGGKPIDDVWDLPNLSATDKKERVGYPTQKPLALLERIIKASSNEGDTVLDPFCGCGTTIIAAQKLNRQWIGIDISKDAYEVSSKRQGELPLDFTHFTYIERTLNDVLRIDKPTDFEKWVNEYFKATKPYPDKGVDGITASGIPIQVKTFQVSYKVLSQFVTDTECHPSTIKPVTKVIVVSQTGFDDGARQRQSEIQSTRNIEVQLATPKELLKL